MTENLDWKGAVGMGEVTDSGQDAIQVPVGVHTGYKRRHTSRSSLRKLKWFGLSQFYEVYGR